MLGIGQTELIIIVVFMFLLFGPDKLPQMGRTIGRALRQFRETQEKMTAVVQTEIVDPMTQAASTAPKPVVEDDEDADLEEGAERPTRPAKKETFAERRARLAAEKAAAEAAEAGEAAAEGAETADAAEGVAAAAVTAAATAEAEPAAEPKEAPASAPKHFAKPAAAPAADEKGGEAPKAAAPEPAAEPATKTRSVADLYARRPKKKPVAQDAPASEPEPAPASELKSGEPVSVTIFNGGEEAE